MNWVRLLETIDMARARTGREPKRRVVFFRSGAASPAWREPYDPEYEVTGV